MLRLGTRADPRFLAEMLYEAAYWRDTGEEERPALDALLAKPEYARYVDGWGRDGDAAVVALARDEPVGAAWYRRFPEAEPGFGFVAADVPELAIGLYPEFRGRGVGSLVLGSLLARARAGAERGVSLSVAAENPARRLYARFGFEVVSDRGTAHTMLVTFD